MMKILTKLGVYVLVAIGATLFNYLYNTIDDGHRGILIFFCFTTVLVAALRRKGDA